MPSSNKTPNLRLNEWLGSDKPRKDDFNADNLAVDTAVGSLKQRVSALEESGSDGGSSEALAAHTADTGIHTSAGWKQGVDAHSASTAVHTTTAWKQAAEAHIASTDIHTTTAWKQTMNTHAANSGIHVTAAEKSAWNSAGESPMVVGTYVGNGSPTRTVDMGFRPRAGFFFGINQGPFEMNFPLEEMECHAGFFSESGCSTFVALTSTGISLTHNSTVPIGGCSYHYNESGVTYVYVAWKK